MRLALGFGLALVLASCVPTGPAERPEPLPPASEGRAPEIVREPGRAPAVPAPAVPRPLVRLDSAAPGPGLNDSLVLIRQARDSALEARDLEALAAAHPPEFAAPDESDAAWRALFDIDVANWMDHHRVKYYLDFFTGPVRERMGIWLTRMPRFEPVIRAALMERGLPGDLAYLPLIESGYSATAVSRSKAVGMWQFMKGTAKHYGLRVDNWVDERRDVPKSTDAAIRFLGDLTVKFGSPYLAAAAYNGGPGRIARGLARIEGYDGAAEDAEDGEPQAGDAAFFLLADSRHIMRETKDYVPKLIAAAMIAKQPGRYGFPATGSDSAGPASQPLFQDSVFTADATGLDVIAGLTGIPASDLWAENPKYIRAVTPPKQRSLVLVPDGRGAEVQEALDALPASERLTSFPHQVKKGETATRIANRYSVTATELKRLNPGLAKRAPVPGSVIRIPGRARLAGWVGQNRRVVSEPDGGISRGATHRVRTGETLSGLSVRYRVSVARLRAWNKMGPNDMLRAGRLLRVRPPAPPPAPKATRASASSAGARIHIVKTGDTLFGLARRYGTTIQSLREANRMSSGQALPVGRRLTIPS